jgi:trimethylamine-N-oxide reductase (cytochrome c)
MIKALRSDKIECVVAQHPWLENDCLFADIILPINTKMEEEDICSDCDNGNFSIACYEGRCIDSLGESKSDWEAVGEVAKALGLYEEYTQGLDVEGWIRKAFAASGLAEKISYEEFKKTAITPFQPKRTGKMSRPVLKTSINIRNNTP